MVEYSRNVASELSETAHTLLQEQKATLEEWKLENDQLERPDFLWHYLLQSFATMGRAAGWDGLIGTKENYDQVRYETLESIESSARIPHAERVCRAAKVRMPATKAKYIVGCFQAIQRMGGLQAAKQNLLGQPGRDAKMRFLKGFPSIGPKYARNIMMDVYHEDFRDSIAIDSRIQNISDAWNLSFASYEEQENFYLEVAHNAGLNGWELDRLMFNFKNKFLPR